MSRPEFDAVERTLLRHYPRCYGCGQSNPESLGITAYRSGTSAHAEWIPPAFAEGGPGVVHGGYVAAVVDEMLALLASDVAGQPAMTAKIELSYLAPVLIERTLLLQAEVVEHRGRKLRLRVSGTDAATGKVCVEATGMQIVVPASYWGEQMARSGIETAGLDLAGGDVSSYFGWHVRWLKEAYQHAGNGQPVRLMVEFADIDPRYWWMAIDGSGLVIEPATGPADDADAWVSIRFADWQVMLRATGAASEVIAVRGGTLRGDPAQLDRFMAALPRTAGGTDG